MELHEMTPSPISPIDAEEYAWLRGNLWYVQSQRLTPLEPRAYDYFAPPEFDPQYSCCHGSQRAVDAWRLVGMSAVICAVIVFWSAVAAGVAWLVGK